MRVLVTGATGFLGGWLVKRLVDEGATVRIIKRAKSHLDELEGLPLETLPGDVTDPESLKLACRDVDSVFHLAGLIAYSSAERAMMDKINVGGTANILAACRETHVRRLVHLSSVTAIGASFDGRKPLDESSEYNVGHLNLGYYETKHLSELLVRNAVLKGEIDAVMVNPSTVYGSGDAKKGSRSTQLKVARGEQTVYPPGGVNIVAVEDVIDGIIAAWKKGRTGERYILASENLLLKDAFDRIAKIAGSKAPWIPVPKLGVLALGKLGDALEALNKPGLITTERAWSAVLYNWFDSTKAQRELGLTFKPADFALENSVRYMRDHGLLRH